MTSVLHRRTARELTLQRFYAFVAAALLAGGATVAVPPMAASAAAQADCSRQPPVAREPIPALPWAQRWFAPELVWPLSRGDDVVVAVVDTGVDARHPQLDDGQVRDGRDLLPEPAGARIDCDSHGTAVASIVAASRAEGIGFSGLAPGVEILPVRVAERPAGANNPEQQVDPEVFADGIRWATEQRVDIINLSVVFYRDYPAIAEAVANAVENGVLVVAAVGPPPEPGNRRTPYPAAYPGVVGVAALGFSGSEDGQGVLAVTSHAGRHVDLVAPGDGVIAATAVAGHDVWSGSSFAAPFVSASAALLLAADPELSPDEAVGRLVATADPGPGPTGPDGLNHRVVNPYRALTERLGDGEPMAAEPLDELVVDPAAEARAERWQRAGRLAALVTISAVALFALAMGTAAVWRRGRRRGWRPLRREAVTTADSVAPGAQEPQRIFFSVPTRRDRVGNA